MTDRSTKSLADSSPEPIDRFQDVERHDSGRLRKNIAALSVLQLLNYALPLAVVPYLTRVLGPAHYGLLIFAQATINYANSITDYGFNYSATRLVARLRDDRDAVSRVFWSTMAAKTLIMSMCFILLAILITIVPLFRTHAALVLASSTLVVGGVLFPMWFFQGIEEMRAITIAQSAAKLLLIPLIFIFVKGPQDIVRAAAIQGGTAVLAGLIGIPLILKTSLIRWHTPTVSELRDTFREGWHLFLSSVSILIYTSTNTLILGFVSGVVQTGYFGAANRAVQASNGLLIPVTQALYPHLNSMAVKSRAAAVTLIRKSVLWIVLVSLCVSIVFLFGASPISHLVFGRRFDGSIEPLRWMAFLPVLLGLSNVFGVQTMLTFGLNKEFNRIVSGSVALNLLLTLPFAKIWGANGAAAALLITEFFVTVTMFFVVRSAGLLSTRSDSRSKTI
jgi:O-antigen/teichoic acid export membrane protein